MATEKLQLFGNLLPPVTETDKGKVLTAKEDGKAEWEEPTDGMSVTEIESPEDIKADSPDGLYIQEGGTSTPSGGTTIHYYDSLDSVPADLPEGSFVAVPSTGGGGGLPVVELETVATSEEAVLSDADTAKMTALNGEMCILKIKVLTYDMMSVATVIMVGEASYMYCFNTDVLGGTVMVTNVDTENGSWVCAIQS